MSKYSKKHRKDPHYKEAKIKGYRARSAYKLLDIQKKYNIFKRAFYIIDLGCHPGSWLQVAKKVAQENLEKYRDQFYHRDHFKILGVDRKKTSSIEGINIIKADLAAEQFHKEISNFFGDSNIDLMLSDASIQKTGIRERDSVMQINLCYSILKLTQRFLKKKGNLVIKAFQGHDFNKFLQKIKYEFKFVKCYKPKSSKKRSNEIYVIGIEKK